VGYRSKAVSGARSKLKRLEQLVRQLDDVEAVINQVVVR